MTERFVRKVGMPLLILAAVALTGCSLASGGAGAGSTYGNPPANTITVSGTGQASGAPDLAFVDLGVAATGTEVGPAVQQSNSTMQSVMDALAQQGIAPEDMRTSGFNVWSEERYDIAPLSPESVGPSPDMPTTLYHVENTVHVTIRDVSKLGDLIQAGLDAGANRVYGVNFSIEDTTSLEQEARAQAVQDARERAADLADEMGVSVGDPVVITESAPYGGPVFEAAVGLGGGGGGGGAPPISGGQLTVTVQVNVSFAMK